MILVEVREQYRSYCSRTRCKELSAETRGKVSEHHSLFAWFEHPYGPGSRATEEGPFGHFRESEPARKAGSRLK